jgi:hypothetical protein
MEIARLTAICRVGLRASRERACSFARADRHSGGAQCKSEGGGQGSSGEEGRDSRESTKKQVARSNAELEEEEEKKNGDLDSKNADLESKNDNLEIEIAKLEVEDHKCEM